MSTIVNTPRCPYCGAFSHAGMCPRVRSVEYWPDGVTVKRIEFHKPSLLAAAAPAILPGRPAGGTAEQR